MVMGTEASKAEDLDRWLQDMYHAIAARFGKRPGYSDSNERPPPWRDEELEHVLGH